MTNNSEIFLLDSNILVYALDKTEKAKHSIAKELLANCFKGLTKCAVSLQNIAECTYVLTEKISKPLSVDNTKNFVQKILDFKGFELLYPTKQTLLIATEIKKEHSIHFWDSLIAAVMKEKGISYIYTEDTADFKKIPWLKTVNPFRKKQ